MINVDLGVLKLEDGMESERSIGNNGDFINTGEGRKNEGI